MALRSSGVQLLPELELELLFCGLEELLFNGLDELELELLLFWGLELELIELEELLDFSGLDDENEEEELELLFVGLELEKLLIELEELELLFNGLDEEFELELDELLTLRGLEDEELLEELLFKGLEELELDT